MNFKKIYRPALLALALLWLLPASIAQASEVVQMPNSILASGYRILFEQALAEDEIAASGLDTLFEEVIGQEAALNEIEALASTTDPAPMSFLQIYNKIESTKKNNAGQKDDMQTESVGKLTSLEKSMWSNDGDLAYQVITVYDNHGAVKHYRDEVQVIVRQVGQGACYTKIDGESKSIYSTGDVVSAYPKDFIMDSTYTIKKKDIDPEAPYTIFTVGHVATNDPVGTVPYTRYETNLYIYWDDDGLAAAPEVSFQYDPAAKKMVLAGANSQMEYRLKTQTSSDWQPCTDTSMYFDSVTGKGTAYYVRYIDGGNGNPSKIQEVILPALKARPDVTYNRVTENIAELTPEMEVQVGNAPYVTATEPEMNISDAITQIPSGSTLTVRVRYKETDTAPAGAISYFTIRPRLAMPTTIKFNPVTNILTGYTSDMHYKGESETGWKSMSGTELNLETYASADSDAKVLVRFKATSENAASLPVEVVIPKLAPGPNGQIDYANEALVNLANINYQYSTNGRSWTGLTISDGQWDISSLVKSYEQKLYLRKAMTSSSPVSAVTVFDLPARPVAPEAPVFVYNDTAYPGKAVLTGLTQSMQYKTENDTDWTNASGDKVVLDIPDAAVTYYVRYSATNQVFASYNKSIKLYKSGSAPSCSYNSNTELISSLNSNMEMKIGNGQYQPVTDATFSVSNLIDDLSAGANTTISVRYKETTTSPVSLEKVFTFYARGEKPTTVVYNANNTLTGCSNLMQYKVEGSENWLSISGTTLNLQNYAQADKNVKVYVRLKATDTAAASLAVEFTIPKMPTGPSGTLDYESEMIVGLDNGAYQYSTDGSTWKGLTISDGTCNMSNIISSSNKKFYLRKSATSTTAMTAPTIFDIPARPSAPTNLAFVYNNNAYLGKAVLTGLTSNMQYKAANETNWTNVNSNQLVLDIPTSSTTYYVRNAATNQAFASSNRSLTLYKHSSAPSCSYNSNTELITSLNENMEMKIGNSQYQPVTDTTFSASSLIDGLSAGTNTTVSVRYKETATAPTSLEKVFTLYARGAKPTTLVYNANDTITGCSKYMEYRLETATSWSSISGSTLNLQNYAQADKNIKVYVRLKATSIAAASQAVEFTIPKLMPGPTGTLDYAKEMIVGLSNGAYQYSTNGTSWSNTTVSNGTYNLSGTISSSNKKFYLRKAATSTSSITAATVFDIPARPAYPTSPMFVYNDAAYPGKAVLTEVNTGMQYKISTASNWINITSDKVVFDIPSSTTTYYVRNAATNQAFASNNRSLKLYKHATAPSCTYNNRTELIGTLNENMEIKIGNGQYMPVTDTTFSASSLIDGLATGAKTTVSVRYKESETAPTSLEKVFTLYARSAKPTTLVYNENYTITGCSKYMEYRLEDATTWTSISGTTLKLQNYAQADRNVKVYVRMKATNTTSASQAVEFTISKLPAGPTGTLDYANEMIVGLENGAYQYSTNGTSWTNSTISNGTFNIASNIGSSIKKIYLRKSATSTSPVTAPTLFELPARPSAPTTPVFVYNDASYPGKVILTGLTSNMQYRKSSDANWINVGGNTTIVFDISSSGTYYVREKATTQSFASYNKSITLYKPGNAPSCNYNSSTELITSLNTSMEMKIGNGQYVPVTATSFSVSSLIDTLTYGSSTTISIRYKETETAPASLEKVFTFNARGAKPTTLVYDFAGNTITGYNNTMEYKLENATSWSTTSNTILYCQKYANTEQDVKVYVRAKATNTESASLPIEFTVPKLLDGPTGTIDYTNESIVGLLNGEYQYSTDNSSWTNLSITNGNWDVSSLLSSSSKKVYLRKAATDSTPVTAATEMTLPARPSAPNTLSVIYNDFYHPEEIIITGLETNMQYKKSTDTDWMDVTATEMSFEPEIEKAVYNIRFKSDGQHWPSSTRSLTLVAKPAAPRCIYDVNTETISGLTTAMEIAFNNEPYNPILSGTTYKLSYLIDNLSVNDTLEVKIRLIATASTPAGQETIFTIGARSDVKILEELIKEPTLPVAPEEPIVPVEPEEPIVPVEPEEPIVPVEPEEPIVPVEPEEPIIPVEPEEPIVPVEPEEPVVPVEPEEPVASDSSEKVEQLNKI